MSALKQQAATPTPDLPLPKQVQRQIDKANAVADEYYKSLKGEAAPPAGEPPAAASPPAGEAPPANNPPAAAAPPAATPLPQEGYEQKYKVLQGKYNAEVPRLQNQVREQGESLRQMREQLTATQTLLASFGSSQASAPAGNAPPASAPAAPAKLVKDEEVREFGADLIDVMRRVVREEQSSLLPEIDRRVAPVAQRVDQVASAASNVARRVSQSDQQNVLAMLAQHVPNWTEVNENPEFLAWLDQSDPYSGHLRGKMLEQAYKSHDGPRVVAFFKGFLNEHAAVTQPAPAASAPPAAPAPQRKLDELVAPGTPKAGAAGTQDGSGKRVWTRAEIGKFYDDCSAGRFNSTDGKARRAAMEADIFAAQREGRVR
jgi:hypothetical protein